MSSHNRENLEAHILPLSKSKKFEIVRQEWDLIGVEITQEFDQCPCGQPIKEHCYIENRLTGYKTYVGNVCIKQFMGMDTGTLFDGLKRIAKNPSANANMDVIDFAWRMGMIYDEREYSFLKSTVRKRNFSPKQLAWKQRVNRRIIAGIVVQKRLHNP